MPWLKTNLSMLKSNNVEVQVKDSQIIIEKGLFKSTHHLMYKVELPSETDYFVKRNDADFDSLH
jgi:hypothetical protein